LALLARLEALDLDLRLDAGGSLVERDLEVVLEIVSAPRPRAPSTLAAAEESFEEVFEDRAESDIAHAARSSHRAEAVVLGSLVWLREPRVGLADLLEALFRLLVAGISIGVVSPGEIAIDALQLGVVHIARDAEHAVVVFGRHRLSRIGRHGDGHHGRAEDPAVEQVAPRSPGDYGHLRLIRGGHARNGFVALGIERLTDRLERNGAELFEHAEELALDQLDLGRHRARSPLALGRLEGSIEIVQHREQLPEHGFVGEPYVVLSLAGGALARVVELGHQPEVSVL